MFLKSFLQEAYIKSERKVEQICDTSSPKLGSKYQIMEETQLNSTTNGKNNNNKSFAIVASVTLCEPGEGYEMLKTTVLSWATRMAL